MSDPLGKHPRNPHDDAEAVALFAGDMLAKLTANNHKAHWRTVSQAWLLERLCDELQELVDALIDGDPEAIRMEAADVGNFALFISDNTRRKP